jgi:hypothetical protein
MATPSPIDPSVKIPEAVRRNAAAAQAAFDAINNIPPEVAPPEVAPPIAPAGEVVPPVTPAGNVEASAQEWQHRFNSMKGRYDRSQNDIRSMSDQIAAMSARMATIESAPQLSPDLNPATFLSTEEVNEYGADFLSVVGKKAQEAFSPEVKAIKDQMAKLQAKLDGNNAANAVTARNNMEVSLGGSCPSWRELNFMPEFHSWLKLPDPFSGAIRHELLTAAYERNDTPRVLAFFNGFLAQEAALAPALDGAPAPAADGKIPLDTFAAPGRAKTAAAAGAPVEKPTFTTAQISQFYADSVRGKFRGKQAEYDRIEAAIFEAQREGRVR